MLLETKTIVLLAMAGAGTFASGTLVKALDTQSLDAVEKYGAMGLLGIMCIGLLALTNKISDNIGVHTKATGDLVTAVRLVHEEQIRLREQSDIAVAAREAAVANLKDTIDSSRQELMAAISRCQRN